MRDLLTVERLAVLDRALRFGDLVILPSDISPREHTKVGKVLAAMPWVRRLFETSPDRLEVPWTVLTALRHRYEEYRMRFRREPWWMRHAPVEFKRHVRHSYYLGDGFYPLAIVLDVSYTGVGYTVAEDGLIHGAFASFGVHRLGGIRQLAYLHDPLSEGIAMRFDHTRYCHVLDVMTLATLMGVKNKLSASDLRHLRVAAFTHDVMTPAGGDTTKMVDREGFDEDRHYPEVFERFDLEPFLRKYRLKKERLIKIVQGEGVLGKLLDVADKIAYVGRDASKYVHQVHPAVFREERRFPPRYYMMKHIMYREFPHVCGIWESVVVADGDVVVVDGVRLGAFLELRARLFRDLYYNPASRFLEHTVSSIVIRDLYETGDLTRDQLLTMQDGELDRTITNVTGMRLLLGGIFGYDHAFVETFETREEAERREDELEAHGDYIVLLEEFVGVTGDGTKILTAKNGKVMPFRDAHPARAERIGEIMRIKKPYRLYYFPIERGFTPWFRGAVQRYRARRRDARRRAQRAS